VLVGIAACTHRPDGPPRAADRSSVPSVANLRFRILELTEEATQRHVAPAGPIFISFATDTFLAETGCNDIKGSYSIDRDNRFVARSASSLRGCPPPMIDQDALLTRVLQSGAEITIEGAELRLRNDGVTLRATLDQN
jgi:heat shock protein HslJ